MVKSYNVLSTILIIITIKNTTVSSNTQCDKNATTTSDATPNRNTSDLVIVPEKLSNTNSSWIKFEQPADEGIATEQPTTGQFDVTPIATESIDSSSTGKDLTESYTMTDSSDYETDKTADVTELTTEIINETNLSQTTIKTTTQDMEDRYVKIAFITNIPKSTTKRSERSTETDTLFQFWSESSVNKQLSGALVESQGKGNHDNVAIEEKTIRNGEDLELNIGNSNNETMDNVSKVSEFDDDERYVKEAADYGLLKMKELYEVEEPKLYNMGLWLEEDNPARFVATFNWQSENVRKFAQYGYASLQASAHLKQKLDDELESRDGANINHSKLASLKKSALRQQCPLRGIPRCTPASKRYRTHDGTCNNPRRGRWGSALTPVERFLPPLYDDEVNVARGLNSDLPSPRLVSSRVHRGRRRDAASVTHLLMQWGQFLDHDITSSSQARSFNGSIPRCCLDGGRHFVPSQFMHPDCMPIEVPEGDDFYGPLGIRCLEFVRSSPAPRVDCEFGWREQMNQVTSYIDASPIYSSSARQADKLRLFRNGLLQYGRAQARRPLLPQREADEESLCRGGAVDASCFKAGDGRVNEHPALVATHIIWLRKHNRLATELGHLNPHWSDEKIYQETRKIIGALIQHITYREFLPVILGSEVMRLFDLDLVTKGYYKGYNSKVNPSPANSFSAAAFRFGHSLVQDSFLRYDRFHRPLANNVSLHDELSNPSNIWSFGAVDRLVLGMCNQPSQKRDEFITPELTNHLFQTSRFGFGMDLGAINIQRGRDHGLPPYVDWREPCGLTPILEWSDLYKIMHLDTVENLRDVYRKVEDVDLFTGGMAERPVIGGLVGPTFACVIAQQFSNLRRGDRFWYENGNFESSFTPAQLQQIRRVSLAQILCQTLETIDTIQPFVFLTVDGFRNERVACNDLTFDAFDLTPWTEREFDLTNNINDFDRTNFIKSSSIKPHSTENAFQTSTTQKDKNTTPTVLDGKLDTEKPHSEKLTLNDGLDNDEHTNTSILKIDDKLDFSEDDQLNKGREDDNSTKLQNLERRSFPDSEELINNNTSKSNESNNTKLKTYNEQTPEKTYDFLLNEDSQLSYFSSLFNNKKPTTRPKPQIVYSQDSYVTDNPNRFTYLINIVPKPTPKYESNYPLRETIKITVQGPPPPKAKPQNEHFPYDKRPIYQNNKLEYRPMTVISTYNNQQSDDTYSKPIVSTNIYTRPKPQQTDYDSNYQSNRPYRPYRPTNDFTTEYNPYSLVTFSHIETTKKYSYYRPSSQSDDTFYNQNYYSVPNKRPTRPPQSDEEYMYNPRPTPPQNTGITIYIENKPSRPKPLPNNDFPNSYNRPFQDANPDETVPLFTRPSYQKPFYNRPAINPRPNAQNLYNSQIRIEENDKKPESTVHHSDISIVLNPNLNKLKSQSTTKPSVKYYYIGNKLHKYPTDAQTSKSNDQIVRENYNNAWKPDKNEHEQYNDPSEDLDPLSAKSDEDIEDDDANIKREKSSGKAKNKVKGQVFFEVQPSENSPMTWVTFNEKPENNIANYPYNTMPPINPDPQASAELPRPIDLNLVRKTIKKKQK